MIEKIRKECQQLALYNQYFLSKTRRQSRPIALLCFKFFKKATILQ